MQLALTRLKKNVYKVLIHYLINSKCSVFLLYCGGHDTFDPHLNVSACKIFLGKIP